MASAKKSKNQKNAQPYLYSQDSLLLIDELGKDVSDISVGIATAYALLEFVRIFLI